jgi:glycosyltransferase involved in cell wall biosynthesis
MVSRMEPWKGHRALLGALARLAPIPGWTCWIVGGPQSPAEGAYERQLRDVARVHGLEARVRFTGHRQDVSEILGASDVFCQPNVEPEPYGMAFVEALHAGLPVVTSAIGGALEIVTGECGVLVRPGDEAALSGALSALITDPTVRDRLGRGARARLTQLGDLASSMRRLQQVLMAAGQVARPPLEAFAG